MNIINDPFRLVIMSVQLLWPDLEAEIWFNPELDYENNEFGATVFPYDGSIPVIFINPQLAVDAAAEILAHEFAHVFVSKDVVSGQEHGEEWGKAFSLIHQRYNELLEAKMKEWKQEGGGVNGK